MEADARNAEPVAVSREQVLAIVRHHPHARQQRGTLGVHGAKQDSATAVRKRRQLRQGLQRNIIHPNAAIGLDVGAADERDRRMGASGAIPRTLCQRLSLQPKSESSNLVRLQRGNQAPINRTYASDLVLQQVHLHRRDYRWN